MHADDSFSSRFFSELLRRSFDVQVKNTDFVRIAMETPGAASRKSRVKQHLIDTAMGFAGSVGIVYTRKSAVEQGVRALQCIVQDLSELERLYARVEDDYSRDRIVELMLFRVLGRYRVKLSRNSEDYWRSHASVDRDLLKEPDVLDVCGNSLGAYEVPAQSHSILLHSHAVNILNTFLLRQYEYRQSGQHFRAERGDVVIDAGGCWGDTALYFADLIGNGGNVYVLEFEEENLKVLQSNIKANDELAPRVHVVERAAWNTSNETLYYRPDGAATSLGRNKVDDGPARREALTIAIDDLVAQEGFERVDYIKMDIEGAELKALAGAETTIRSFRPKLAISLYHLRHDFTAIPRYIDDLNLNYRMAIDHFTIHQEETMLYAWPPSHRPAETLE